MNKNTILAIVFLCSGRYMLTSTVVTAPDAFAGGDGDGNYNKAKKSQIASNDCDDNEVTHSRTSSNSVSQFCYASNNDNIHVLP